MKTALVIALLAATPAFAQSNWAQQNAAMQQQLVDQQWARIEQDNQRQMDNARMQSQIDQQRFDNQIAQDNASFRASQTFGTFSAPPVFSAPSPTHGFLTIQPYESLGYHSDGE